MEGSKTSRRAKGEAEAVPSRTAVQVDENLQIQLRDLLGEILAKAQELGFELATLECSDSHNCPLAKKSRELIVVLKKLFALRPPAR